MNSGNGWMITPLHRAAKIKLGVGVLAHDRVVIDMSDSGVRLHVAGRALRPCGLKGNIATAQVGAVHFFEENLVGAAIDDGKCSFSRPSPWPWLRTQPLFS